MSLIDDKTQSFPVSNIDATMPGIDLGIPNNCIAELVIVRGPSTGQSFVLDIPEVTIGRDPKCEVFLNDRTVSRRHAHLSLEGGKAVIEDLGSLNGTWVNGAIVSQAELTSGATIQIGTFKMILTFH